MSLFLTLISPFLGGLIYGLERRLRARMQRRQGPPILQPFYDMFKLMDKRTLVIHSLHAMLSVLHFLILWVVVGALFYGVSLLYIVFLHLFALIVLVLAGYSVRSAYSHLGANRELMALVAYEPVLLLVAVGFYLNVGSFDVSAILNSESTLSTMTLLFLALLIVMPIKLKKSPFDVVEAHQEIVGGVEVEYSGLFYEFLYMARFMEYVFVYSLVFLFGGDNYLLGLFLVLGVFLLINLVDNATARVRQDQMLKLVYTVAISLGVINLLGILV